MPRLDSATASLWAGIALIVIHAAGKLAAIFIPIVGFASNAAHSASALDRLGEATRFYASALGMFSGKSDALLAYLYGFAIFGCLAWLVTAYLLAVRSRSGLLFLYGLLIFLPAHAAALYVMGLLGPPTIGSLVVYGALAYVFTRGDVRRLFIARHA